MLSAEAKLRRITLTEVWIILDVMRNPNKTIKQSLVILQVYLFSRAFEFELLAVPGLGHNNVQ
jgi:hypothetical protein